MTRKCFFIEQQVVDQNKSHVTLIGQAAHHLSHVLRLQAGDLIELRDGHGRGWEGVITEVEGGTVLVRLKEEQPIRNESALELTLALAYSRSDRMDLVLRQATELGVHRFVAFRARRSQYGLSASQEKKRKERWLKIAREALCQCERTRLPHIMLLADTHECIQAASSGREGDESERLVILALEKEGAGDLMGLWRKVPGCRHVWIVVGPEGGWTEQEADEFTKAGFHSICLGPRILRLETATVAFLTSAQLLWGDLSHEGDQR